MLPTLFFELQGEAAATEADDNNQQDWTVEQTESEEAKKILNKMSGSAKDFARAVNVKMANGMKEIPDEDFETYSNTVKNNIKALNEKGDVEGLINQINTYKDYLQGIAKEYNDYRTGALNAVMKEEPFASMDKTVLSDNKQNILDYLSESKKEYKAIKDMTDIITGVLKDVNSFDYEKAGVKKPDLTETVKELTGSIFDNDGNVVNTEEMLLDTLKQTDSDADSLEELEKQKEAEGNEKEDELKDGITLKVDRPKALSEAVQKFEKNLNTVDRNILDVYYDDGEGTVSPYLNKGFITSKGTKEMTPEGLVLFCGMALNHTFPEREGDIGDDIDLRMESINYNGGTSNAVIRYSIPEKSKGAEFDTEKKRYGKDIDSQWLEARIQPGTKMKEGMGRAELVISTFDKDDPSKLVVNRGKRISIVEFIKQLRGEKKNKWDR